MLFTLGALAVRNPATNQKSFLQTDFDPESEVRLDALGDGAQEWENHMHSKTVEWTAKRDLKIENNADR